MYDSRFKRDFKAKLCTRWLGPYQINKVIDDGIVHWVTIDEDQMALFANGHRMRLYHKTISKDAFISCVAVNLDYQLMQGQEFFSTPVNSKEHYNFHTGICT